MKRVLVMNGNYPDIRLIQFLKKLGYYVITSGNNPSLAGHRYADQYVCHDYSDYVGMLEVARDLDVDYVSACSDDFGVITAAYVAEQLGLPGHDTFLTARTIAEKNLFKKFAQENGLQVIPSIPFDDLETAIEYVRQADYPIIVKPNDLNSGKGVSRADNEEESIAAVKLAFDKSRSKHIVVEPYVEGTQHSICTFLVNRKVKTYVTINEESEPNNPFLVGSNSLPSDDSAENTQLLIDQIEKMAELLHCVDGVFHVQYRLKDGVPYIMECMRRCLGNYSLYLASYGSGFDWEEWIARAYCGMDCADIPKIKDSGKLLGATFVQAPRNGIVKNVTLGKELERYLCKKIDHWKPGMVIENYSIDKLSFLWFEFPDKTTMKTVMTRFEDKLYVEMVDC